MASLFSFLLKDKRGCTSNVLTSDNKKTMMQLKEHTFKKNVCSLLTEELKK